MPKLKLKEGSRPPWVGLAAAIWVDTAGGNGFTFPLYTAALKSVLGFNQQQITILGVANDLGENVGIHAGIACNKFPPWAVLLAGVIACFLGYGVVWLAITKTVVGLPFWVLWIALVVGANSNAWFSTAVLVTNMRNFPLSRGTVAGILKGYIATSAAIYTVLYSTVLQKSASNLLLFLALGLPAVCLATMYLIRPCAPPSGEDSSVHAHFVFVQVASVLLAIYLVILTVLFDKVSVSETITYILLAIVVILLLAPLAIPIKMTLFRANAQSLTPLAGSTEYLAQEEGDSAKAAPLLTPSSSASNLGSFYESDNASDVETLLAVGEGAVKKKRRPRRGEDFKFHEAFIKADFWLLWIVYFLGVGSAYSYLNNLAQIGVAFGADDTTILLCVFSFCNFVGRLGSGALSEHFVRSRAMPRTVWMTCSLIVMGLAFVLFALDVSGSLYVSTALVGICCGFLYNLNVPISSELFGLKHFGVIYNFMQLGNPAGALLFSGLLAGYVYDTEAAKQGSSICLGVECYRLTFWVLAGCCGVGTILCILLTIRIQPVYRTLYASGSFRLPQSSNH